MCVCVCVCAICKFNSIRDPQSKCVVEVWCSLELMPFVHTSDSFQCARQTHCSCCSLHMHIHLFIQLSMNASIYIKIAVCRCIDADESRASEGGGHVCVVYSELPCTHASRSNKVYSLCSCRARTRHVAQWKMLQFWPQEHTRTVFPYLFSGVYDNTCILHLLHIPRLTQPYTPRRRHARQQAARHTYHSAVIHAWI